MPHDVSVAAANKVESMRNSLDLRKSHFLFGTDQPTFKKYDVHGSYNWRNPTPNLVEKEQVQKDKLGKQSAMEVAAKDLNNKSNFNIGNSVTDSKKHFQSMNRQAMESVKNKPTSAGALV